MIKIYGIKEKLNPIKKELSNIIHSCMVDALDYPEDKKFQRFFPMDREDFYYQSDRSDDYTVIEITMFEGRTKKAKRELIRFLFKRTKEKLGIENKDIEITIFETPASNWGIRGVSGDELKLNYTVKV